MNFAQRKSGDRGVAAGAVGSPGVAAGKLADAGAMAGVGIRNGLGGAGNTGGGEEGMGVVSATGGKGPLSFGANR